MDAVAAQVAEPLTNQPDLLDATINAFAHIAKRILRLTPKAEMPPPPLFGLMVDRAVQGWCRYTELEQVHGFISNELWGLWTGAPTTTPATRTPTRPACGSSWASPCGLTTVFD